MGSRGVERLEDFSLERVGKQWRAAIEELVEASHHGKRAAWGE